jgi:hypothetical protein
MLLVFGGGCHLFFKKLGGYLLLLVVRVHVHLGKWTNTCQACRRDATREVARQWNIGWWEEGQQSACNRPTDWRGVVPAATEQLEGRGRGDLRRESAVREFSHRQSGPVPAFLSSEVPERTLGAGDGLDSPDG